MDKFERVKEFMINKFKSKLWEIFYTKGYERYKEYRFNSCRQSSVFGKIILEEIMPEYKWVSCEALIETNFLGKRIEVEHAWIFGYSKSLGGIVVDIESSTGDKFFKSNINKMIGSRKIKGPIKRLNETLDDIEFITQIRANEIFSILRKNLDKDIKELMEG